MSRLSLPLRGLLVVCACSIVPLPRAAAADAFTPVPFKGHFAHPTRVLARLKSGPRPAAAQAAQSGDPARSVQELAFVPRLLVIEFDEPTAAGAAAQAAGSTAAAVDSAARLAARIEALRASGNYEYVEPDYLVFGDAVPNDTAFTNGTLWGLRNTGQNGGVAGVDIDAVRAWDVTKGSTSVIVAIIDSGIRTTHADLASQMWINLGEKSGDGVDNDGNGYVDDVFGINASTDTGDVSDTDGHGTHIAGIIGAAANNGHPAVGVAWNVRLMACKFMDDGGEGFISEAIEAIGYATDHGATILNCSWGLPVRSRALGEAIEAAGRAGVLVVAAAGNDNTNNDSTPHFPSNYELDNVIAVAAIDRDGSRATFSNYGAKSVDLGAPGVSIYSTSATSNTAYVSFQGTSMAAPHVAGVAALVRARFPGISVADLRNRIVHTTTATPSLSGITATGGRVNAYRALTATGDGTLELSFDPPLGTVFFHGRETPVAVRVTDLIAVPGATVTGSINGTGSLTLRDDGIGADEVANDGRYTALAPVPGSGSQFTLDVTASAPGKTGAAASITYPLQAPPPNDNFADRIALNPNGGTVTTHNFGATVEPGEPMVAGEFGGASLWWTWTAPVNAKVTVDTVGSDFDTLLGVFTGTQLASLVEVASNDDIDGPDQPSRVTFGASAGTTYQIVVDGWEGDIGNVVLNLNVAIPPPNDNFADRTTLSGTSVTAFGNDTNATLEPGEPPVPGRNVTSSIWWQWTAPWSGTAVIRTNNFGLNIAVYTGSSLTSLVRQPGTAYEERDGFRDRLTFSATAGVSYAIAVSRVGEGGGHLQFTLELTEGPANDRFAAAEVLSGDRVTVTGTTVNATQEAGEPSHGNNTQGASIWWRWTAPASGTIFLDTKGSEYEPVVAVYEGASLPFLTRLSGEAATTARVGVAAGREYHIAVDARSIAGAVQLQLRFDLQPPNDMFADRIRLSGTSFKVSGTNVGATRELGEPVLEQFIDGATVWWSWTAPKSGTLEIISQGEDPWLMVYTGSELATLVRQPNSLAGGREVRVRVEQGVEYHLAVDSGFLGNGSTFTLAFDFYDGPPNDQFAGRGRLTGRSFAVAGDLGRATLEPGEPTFGAAGRTTVWWSWTAPANGTAIVELAAEDGWPAVTVTTGTSLTALTLVAGATDRSGSGRRLRFPATAGTTYHLTVNSAVSSTFGSTGTFRLTLMLVDPPLNDHFANRSVIVGNSATVTGSNIGASYEAGEEGGSPPGAGTSVWWTWTAPADGGVILTTAGSTFDALLQVFRGSSGNLETVAFAHETSDQDRSRRAVFATTAGTAYHFRVEGANGATGKIQLGLEFLRRPDNDNFANRATLTGSRVTVDAHNLGATIEGGEPDHGVYNRSRSVWWTWTAPASGRAAVTIVSAFLHGPVTVYTGASLAGLQPVASTDASASQTFTATAGTVYQIAVASDSPEGMGKFELTVALVTPPSNETFAGRKTLSGAEAHDSTSNLGAMAAPGDPNYDPYRNAPTLWWSWTAPASMHAAVSTADSAIETDLIVYVRSATGEPRFLTSAGGTNVRPDHVAFPVTAGETYFIRVSGRHGQMGSIELHLSTGEVPQANATSPGKRLAGSSVTLSATASGTGPMSYQWMCNGMPIAGATDATYVLPSAQTFHTGVYSVEVTNDFGSSVSSPIVLEVEPPPPSNARVLNLSTRALDLTGDDVLIPGFVISGPGTKRLLIRAVGPSLGRLGVKATLPDPRVSLRRWNGAKYDPLAFNDDWHTNTNAPQIIQTAEDVFAFALDEGSADAALLVDLPAGQYSVIADDVGGRTGVAMVELYDADDDASRTASLINISNRGYVGTGESIMIPGFVVSREGPKTFLIRAVGPGLLSLGVNGVLADPTLTIYRRNQAQNRDEIILSNDDWGVGPGAQRTRDVAKQVFAFALPEGSTDAALVVTLNPGIYTVHARGKDDTEGVALVELYVVP